MTWTQRVINEKELEALSQRDMDLSPSASRRILAKLNARDFDYIAQDIRDGQPIKVPNDFTAFKSWTPLEKYIPDVADLPKFILIVKELPYIGWYERGKLVGDTYICVGKVNSMTAEGVYAVKEKDLNHVSRSYPNAYGEPAPMPWALRIYGTVWIHAGDIVSGHCSHGCVNLPIFPAMKLFEWATPGTPVLIVDSLGALRSVLAENRSNCTLHALVCSSVSQAQKTVDGFVSAASAALSAGDKITLVGFGTFSVGTRSQREGRNPRTGEKIKIAASRVVKFKADKTLSEKIK